MDKDAINAGVAAVVICAIMALSMLNATSGAYHPPISWRGLSAVQPAG